MVSRKSLAALVAFSVVPIQCIDLDVTSTDSVKSAASTIAKDLVGLYNQSQTPGNPIGVLSAPYFWWETGAMFDTLVQYWRLTGDSQYNELVAQGLTYQQGPNNDFMPTNQTQGLGNDDQSTWALAAMSAAEARLGEVQNATWFDLANAVFMQQAARWDDQTCNGGLRWQIFSFNNGYTYKNSISNGNFFQLAARLAAYTGNSTYSDWATKTWNWSKASGFIDDNFNVYDGADVTKNCSSTNHVQFSESAGTFIVGAAYMFNITNGDSQWKTSLDGLLNRTIELFFPSGIATEIACEPNNSCSTDQRAYKGILGKWLADTVQVAPYTFDAINKQFMSSAQAAVKTCGNNGCALVWSGKETNNSTSASGVGEQIDALDYVQGLLSSQAAAPATQNSTNATTTSSGSGGSASTSASASASATKNAAAGMVAGQSALGFSFLGAVAWLVL